MFSFDRIESVKTIIGEVPVYYGDMRKFNEYVCEVNNLEWGKCFEEMSKRHGFVAIKGESKFIFVDTSVSEDVQRTILRHEILHVNLGHLWRDITVDEKEQEVEEQLLKEGYTINYKDYL